MLYYRFYLIEQIFNAFDKLKDITYRRKRISNVNRFIFISLLTLITKIEHLYSMTAGA